MAEDKMELISMMLITYAGSAKSAAMMALDMAENGKFIEAEELMKEANKNILLAGKEHFKAMELDMNGELKLNLLFVHAEDQMLSAETTIALSQRFIKLWMKVLDINNQ